MTKCIEQSENVKFDISDVTEKLKLLSETKYGE